MDPENDLCNDPEAIRFFEAQKAATAKSRFAIQYLGVLYLVFFMTTSDRTVSNEEITNILKCLHRWWPSLTKEELLMEFFRGAGTFSGLDSVGRFEYLKNNLNQTLLGEGGLVIEQLVGLAKADGEFTEDEKSFIQFIKSSIVP